MLVNRSHLPVLVALWVVWKSGTWMAEQLEYRLEYNLIQVALGRNMHFPDNHIDHSYMRIY